MADDARGERVGMISRLWLAIAGMAIGVVVAIILQPRLHGELFSVPFPLWGGALLGLASAEVFWRLRA